MPKVEHQGQKLKRILVLSELKPEQLAEQLGKGTSTIYKWYEEEKFPKDRIALLKSVGVDVTKEPTSVHLHQNINQTNTVNGFSANYEKEIERMEALIEQLRAQLRDKDEIIALLKKK